MKEILLHLTQLLTKELDRLKNVKREIRLFSGSRIGEFAGQTYYRFEIPEEIIFQPFGRVLFTCGQQQPMRVIGQIVSLENQYMTAALSQDFGEYLPEALCSWNYENLYQPVLALLRQFDASALVPFLMFHPSDSRNNHLVTYEIQNKLQEPAEHLEAIKKIWQNRVSLVWGPSFSGTAQTLITAAASYIKTRRKVLIIGPTAEHIDSLFLSIVRAGEELGIPMKEYATRVDLPLPGSFEAMAQYSFEQQQENLKDEKRKAFQERISLLNIYWTVKRRQILNEDFYRKVQEKRDRLAELRTKIDQVSREKTQLNQVVAELENESLVGRLKKGFSKNELHSAHERLANAQQVYNRLLTMQQGVSNEITEIELDAPVTAKEMMEFKETGKRIDELGGLTKVTEAVENFIAIDSRKLLQPKLIVASSIQSALENPVIREQQYALVIVQDAQSIPLPTLTAISEIAREKLIIAGNPFEVESLAMIKTGEQDSKLQVDIFRYCSQTTEFNKLIEWSEQNPRWSIFMKSQYLPAAPTLTAFLSSAVFEKKIIPAPSLNAKGKITFIDTSAVRSRCKQYTGKNKTLLYNELHTKQVIECVKHILIKSMRGTEDIGIIVPFSGPTLHTKHQLRLQGLANIEVGTPHSFCGRQKRSLIFDTTMAGVDYTMQSLDDTQVGKQRVARLFNTVASCAGEDLYIIADMSHFKFLYADRFLTHVLELLQAEADERQPVWTDSIRKFDELGIKEREIQTALHYGKENPPVPSSTPAAGQKVDRELEIQMKKMTREWESKLASASVRDIEREVYIAVNRVLGWRTDVNLVSQFIGGDLLFRNSPATEKASRKLPKEICENENHFRDAMELWNLIVYEMSGGNKIDMSFFASKGPESRMRQDIRNLHMYYSSEVEAAIEEGKKKMAVEVARVFQELLGKNRPDNPADWTQSYLKFLARLEAYLSWVSEQVRR